jgi:hypothetical protein
MQRLCALLALVGAVLVATTPAYAGEPLSQREIYDRTPVDFTTGIEDLPLMPGLRPVPLKDTIMTGPYGRIAETMAVGAVDVDEVYYFYARTLPELGWQAIDKTRYIRDGELLTIDVNANKRDRGYETRARFLVTPRS